MKWAVLYKNILSDVARNSVALFMVEMLYKTLKQPEINADLFYFCEDAFLELDAANNEVTANFPIYFALQLVPFLGFQLLNNYSETNNVFNISEGEFSNVELASPVHLSKENSFYISELLKARRPVELQEIKMNRTIRRSLLKDIESYYSWHLPDFGSLKTLSVLHEIL
jgi:DNA repair protein RecO (recombination protein O)